MLDIQFLVEVVSKPQFHRFEPSDTAVDWDFVVFNGLTIQGIYGKQMNETRYKMSAMIHSGLDSFPVITHRLPCTEYEEAFDGMRAGQSGNVIQTGTQRANQQKGGRNEK